MAGNEIRISSEEMGSRATQYEGQADIVNEVIANMDVLLGELQEEWKGQASEAYAIRYGELKPSFQKMEELIREIATVLRETASAMDEADSAIAGRFQ